MLKMQSNKTKQIIIILLFSVLVMSAVFNSGCATAPDFSAEKDLTKIPLDWALSNSKPTLADFGWRDCIPCKMMKPVLEKLAVQQRGHLNVLIVEVYSHQDLTDRYGVTAIPTQILFDIQGKELMRHEGYWAPEEIAAQLKQSGIN
jgi:thioredoxin 1